MVEVSRDGKRVYFSNSLYGAWDEQFYPDGVGAWIAKLDVDTENGGIAFDERFFLEGDAFRGRRVHQVRLRGRRRLQRQLLLLVTPADRQPGQPGPGLARYPAGSRVIRRQAPLRKLCPVGTARGRAVPNRGGCMVTRDTAWPAGTPCWVDLGVDDVARAGTFYSRLFGWDIQAGPPEAGGYTMCLKDGHPVAGIAPKQGPPDSPDRLDRLSRLRGCGRDGGQGHGGRRPGSGGAGGRDELRPGRDRRRPGGGGVRDLAGPSAHRARAGQRAGFGVLERELQPRPGRQQGVLQCGVRLRVWRHVHPGVPLRDIEGRREGSGRHR